MRFLLIPAAILVSTSAFGQRQENKDAFPDTPKNHWAYEAIADLRSEGLLVGYPEGLGRPAREWGRYDMAVATHAAIASLPNLLAGLRQTNLRVARGSLPLPMEHETSLRRFLDATPRFEKHFADLTAEFEPELKALGADIAAMRHQIRVQSSALKWFRIAKPGEALKPFSDVPKNHWASKAIVGLRFEGVMVGYSNGKFGG